MTSGGTTNSDVTTLAGSTQSGTVDSASSTFYAVSAGNDCTWRVEWPAQAVGGRAMLIPEENAAEIVTKPNNDSPLPWRIVFKTADGRQHVTDTPESYKRFVATSPDVAELRTQFPMHEGVAVFTRPDPPRAILAQAMRANGVHTVAETDDNYFCPPNQNLFLRQSGWDAAGRMAHAKSMVRMDANVFSTGWLRDLYHRKYRELFGKQGMPEMHVCRNHIPREMWPAAPDYDGPLRIGFMGSPSHVWDVNLAYTAFHAAKQLGCATVMIGYSPANPDPDKPDEMLVEGKMVKLLSDKSIAVRSKWQAVVDEHVRWIHPTLYHRTPLPIDIGLCPLLSNKQTFGKSDIKAIEYAVSGAVAVVQNHPVYTAGGWEHEVNCLLAGSQEEMGLATVRLIQDPKLRRELLENAQTMVREQRNEDVMREEWNVALAL